MIVLVARIFVIAYAILEVKGLKFSFIMSEKKESETIVGSVKGKHALPSLKVTRRREVIAGVILLAVVVLTGVVFLFNRAQQNKEKKAFQTAVTKSGQLIQKRDSSGAKHAWEDFLATKPKNKEVKSHAEYYLAQTLRSVKDYPGARKYGELSLTHTAKPDYNNYLFLADLTKLQEDYSAAADYYQKAYDALKPETKENAQAGALAEYAKSNVVLMKELIAQKKAITQ